MAVGTLGLSPVTGSPCYKQEDKSMWRTGGTCLHQVPPSEDNKCGCGDIQNVVYLRGCLLVGNGKERSAEEVWSDLVGAGRWWIFLRKIFLFLYVHGDA